VTARRGLQAEVLVSLALVMVAATGSLAAILVSRDEILLREILARALVAEAQQPSAARALGASLVSGTTWWTLEGDGRGAEAAEPPPDAAARTLAREAARAGSALLVLGAPWEPIRFATPVEPGGRVAVARLPAAASTRLRGAPRAVAGLVLLADLVVFTAFGAYLLRRRLVLPLRHVSEAARAIADGDLGTRVPVEGARETADLAQAFNRMTEALAGRTTALEKAVADLRDANAHLRDARAGLDRAERLASVGRLAAGVAHEVGNPMGAILAFLDLAGREPGLPPRAAEHLARAGREGERVRRILRQLLDFARPPRASLASVDVAAVAEETAALVRAQRRYADVAIEVVREGASPAVRGDAGALMQILLNLLLNAADAVRGSARPRVTVRVRPAAQRLRAGDAPEAAAARRQADAVECRVEDDGSGIPAEDRERIFDPFFTTKPPGEGTGLGLANALRLAEEMGGSLELRDPEPGTPGSVLALVLPAARAEAAPAAEPQVRSAP
jgi:hypothetical protein